MKPSAVFFALFLGLAVIIVVIIARGPRTLEYPTNRPIAFSVSCMDLRFVKTNNDFLRRTYGYNAYDSFVCPGPAASLGKSLNITTGGGLGNVLTNAQLVESTAVPLPGPPTYKNVDQVFYDAFIRARTISDQVNESEQVVLMEHENCGYYVALAGGTLSATQMRISQLNNLRIVKAQLLRDHPSLFTGGIKLYWVSLKAEIVEIV